MNYIEPYKPHDRYEERWVSAGLGMRLITVYIGTW